MLPQRINSSVPLNNSGKNWNWNLLPCKFAMKNVDFCTWLIYIFYETFCQITRTVRFGSFHFVPSLVMIKIKWSSPTKSYSCTRAWVRPAMKPTDKMLLMIAKNVYSRVIMSSKNTVTFMQNTHHQTSTVCPPSKTVSLSKMFCFNDDNHLLSRFHWWSCMLNIPDRNN